MVWIPLHIFFHLKIHLFPAQTGSISTTIVQESFSPAQEYLNIPPSNALSHQPVPKLCQHSWSSNHPFNCCPDGVPVILICWQPIPFYLYSLAARTLSLEMLLLPVPGFWGWGSPGDTFSLGRGCGTEGAEPLEPFPRLGLSPWKINLPKSRLLVQGLGCKGELKHFLFWSFPPSKAFCHLPAEELQCWRISQLKPSEPGIPLQTSLRSHPLGAHTLHCLSGQGSDADSREKAFLESERGRLVILDVWHTGPCCHREGFPEGAQENGAVLGRTQPVLPGMQHMETPDGTEHRE